jgi:hypothetical protein
MSKIQWYLQENKQKQKSRSMVLYMKIFRQKHIDALDASILCHLNITSNTQKLEAKHVLPTGQYLNYNGCIPQSI